MQIIQHFGRHMTAWTVINQLLAAGYRSQFPTRCPRLILVHRRHRREWRHRHRVWDLRFSRYCIFCDVSRLSQYYNDGRVRVRGRQVKRLDDCIQPTHGSPSQGLGCNSSWREEQPGHPGWDQEQALLHQIRKDHMLSWARGVLRRNLVFGSSSFQCGWFGQAVHQASWTVQARRVRALVESMPRHVQAVLAARRRHMHY